MGLLSVFYFLFLLKLMHTKSFQQKVATSVRHIGFVTRACAIPVWVQERESLFLSWTLRKFVQTKLPRKMKIKQDLKHWAMQGNKPCFWILLDYYTSLHEGCDPANCQRKLAKIERQFISHSLVKNYRFGYDKFVLFKTILNFSMIIANSGEKTWITEYWAPE